jgi:membrane associated rhomboid family serine protease
MLPLWDTQPHRRVPVLTTLLIVACLVVFGVEVVLYLENEERFSLWLKSHAIVPERLLRRWHEPVEWRTMLSSMFLHGGVAHLLGNAWYLWVFGNNVEDRLGFFGFALFYVFTGVVAGMVQVFAAPDSTLPLVGASGAISGVLGAYLVFFPRAWVVSLVPWIVPVVPVPAVVFLLLWFWVQAYSGLGVLLSGAAGEGGVAWWAHAGGFVAGAGVALCLPVRGRR